MRINRYIAYRLGRKGADQYKTFQQRRVDHKSTQESFLGKCCSDFANNYNCPFWYALHALQKSRPVPQLQYHQQLQRDLEWHLQHGEAVEPRDNNWKESLTVITAMAYRNGDKYAQHLAKKQPLKLVFETIDWSGWDSHYVANCAAVAERFQDPDVNHLLIFSNRAAYRSIIQGIWEEEEGEQLQLTPTDFNDNVPGLGWD